MHLYEQCKSWPKKYIPSWAAWGKAGLISLSILAVPGCSGLKAEQIHGYFDGSTRSGVTVRGLKRGDLQQHKAPLSYQRSVATSYHPGGVIWRSPLLLPLSAHLSWGREFRSCDRQKLIRHINQLLAWRDDIHAHADFPVLLPSHKLARCCLEPSFCSSILL